MRNRSILYFAGFLVAVIGFLVFDYSLRAQYLNRSSRAVAEASSANLPQQNSAGSEMQAHTRFLNRFKNFVTQMSAITDDPEQSDEYLHEFTQTVQPSDIVVLSDVLNNIKLANDERSLALELMMANQDFNSHNLLNTFIQNENFGQRANPDFELALRAQAIEGLTLYADKKLVRKNLENLKIRTKQAFLYDRANRALDFISGKNLETQLDSADVKASTR